MMRGIFTLSTFVSVVFFPWPFTALLAVAVSSIEPLLPLAVGIFADTLYYTPHAAVLPFFTFVGAIVTGIAFFVRSKLKTSIIEG